jgi:hypothetical protein
MIRRVEFRIESASIESDIRQQGSVRILWNDGILTMGFEHSLQAVMMVAGMALLCWMMLRSRRHSRSSRDLLAEFVPRKDRGQGRAKPYTGTASAGAPQEVQRWQVEFYDIVRQLKAELDSKIVAVRQLSQDYESAANHLTKLIAEARELNGTGLQAHQMACRLRDAGCSTDQIASGLGIPVWQVQEFSSISSAQK